MKIAFYLLVLILFSNFKALAQCYESNIAYGKQQYNAGQYEAAKATFQKALSCGDANGGNEAKQWIGKCNTVISEQCRKVNVAEGIGLYNSGQFNEARTKFIEAKKCSSFDDDSEADGWLDKLFKNYTETAGGAAIDMVAIKGGTFTMGSPESELSRESDEQQHSVTVSDFYIGKSEVTVAQFKEFVDATGYKTDAENGDGSFVWNGSSWKKKAGVNWRCDERGNTRSSTGYNNPVIHVSWNDATAYCNWLSQKTGKTYRLPTEAEWEYVCRAGTTTPFNTGSNLTTSQANYNGNFPYNGYAKGEYCEKTLPVGSFLTNAWGLYDMHGNVCEWCSDWYSSEYYSCSPQSNPQGPSSGLYRVYRGGAWDNFAEFCRSAHRSDHHPTYRNDNLGFRLVSQR